MMKSETSSLDLENPMNGRPELQRMKAMRFEHSKSRFENISPFKIIFQGLFRLWLKFCDIFCNCSPIFKGESDYSTDTINISHKDPIKSSDLSAFFGTLDVESGAIIESKNVTNVTDKVFRDACNEASITCMNYAWWFMVMDKISKIAETFALIILPIAMFIEFDEFDYIISISVIIPFFIARVLFDWSVLMEKYANISHEFSCLANNKHNDRVDNYETLVNRFRSSWIYADKIKLKSL